MVEKEQGEKVEGEKGEIFVNDELQKFSDIKMNEKEGFTERRGEKEVSEESLRAGNVVVECKFRV